MFFVNRCTFQLCTTTSDNRISISHHPYRRLFLLVVCPVSISVVTSSCPQLPCLISIISHRPCLSRLPIRPSAYVPRFHVLRPCFPCLPVQPSAYLLPTPIMATSNHCRHQSALSLHADIPALISPVDRLMLLISSVVEAIQATTAIVVVQASGSSSNRRCYSDLVFCIVNSLAPVEFKLLKLTACTENPYLQRN